MRAFLLIVEDLELDEVGRQSNELELQRVKGKKERSEHLYFSFVCLVREDRTGLGCNCCLVGEDTQHKWIHS